MIFKNSGSKAGATLSHPHCQLIALPVVCREVDDEIRGSSHYFDFKERCVFCDMIKQELNEGRRLVARSSLHVAITPFASRFPFEVWILPIRHSSRFEMSDAEEIKSAAEVLWTVLGMLSKVLCNPPYNFYLHNAPLRVTSLPHYHWHFEILPAVTTVAGFERGSAFYINPTPPEEAAEELRKIRT
jgi:UDPglucose--hexose-1-phosphate uridylyltransferase